MRWSTRASTGMATRAGSALARRARIAEEFPAMLTYPAMATAV
nr:hypothetical protein [Streptomyces sp. S1D4-11]